MTNPARLDVQGSADCQRNPKSQGSAPASRLSSLNHWMHSATLHRRRWIEKNWSMSSAVAITRFCEVGERVEQPQNASEASTRATQADLRRAISRWRNSGLVRTPKRLSSSETPPMWLDLAMNCRHVVFCYAALVAQAGLCNRPRDFRISRDEFVCC